MKTILHLLTLLMIRIPEYSLNVKPWVISPTSACLTTKKRPRAADIYRFAIHYVTERTIAALSAHEYV